MEWATWGLELAANAKRKSRYRRPNPEVEGLFAPADVAVTGRMRDR